MKPESDAVLLKSASVHKAPGVALAAKRLRDALEAYEWAQNGRSTTAFNDSCAALLAARESLKAAMRGGR